MQNVHQKFNQKAGQLSLPQITNDYNQKEKK